VNHSLNSLSFSALLSAIALYFFELYMAYTGRHSYFLCFLLFVFRRSPARLAVKKYAHAKREEDFFTSNQPEGPPCGTGLKNNYFCRKK
ncbi:hypothetical protein, partial [Akkermansia sp.]